jgi:hypothetical protein
MGAIPLVTPASTNQVRKPEIALPPQPVGEEECIVGTDVLRGFAFPGILPMNIQYFSMIGAAYSNPTAYGDLTGINYWVRLLCHVFAHEKFMTIFSMGFGAGILRMTSRIEAAGKHAAGLYYRRMGRLIAFGLAHASACPARVDRIWQCDRGRYMSCPTGPLADLAEILSFRSDGMVAAIFGPIGSGSHSAGAPA